MIHKFNSNAAEYPKKLTNRLQISPDITVLGDVSCTLSKGIAVIGSRYNSKYSQSVVQSLIEEFAKYDITIISGLAPGVDTCAHEMALSHNLSTIGVLGFGFDYLYEFENYELVKKIVNSKNKGCVISPFKSSQIPQKHTFIERNKIISALADAIIVVEATIRSGTYYTVQSAVEFDVPVFAIPGSIFSKNSCGTHNLIKSGAFLADSAQDIIDTLNFDNRVL